MKRFALCVFLLLVCASIASAQTGTATVLGTVKDASGASVPGATVTMRNIDTAQTRTATSGADGSYRVEAVPVGNYEVRAEQTGFKAAVRTGITLTVTQQLVLDFALEVGEVSQEVEVTEKAEQVNTTSAVLGAVVDEKQVLDLPLNGRNYVMLALLQAGVTEQKNRIQNASANLASQGTFYSSNGAPTRSNRYLLDGTNLAEYGYATASSISGTTLGLDGIREFRLLSATFDAQYGMSMGSQMVVVSKSGANAYHGDAFEFVRNSAIDARNFFDTPVTAGVTSSGAPRRLPPFRRSNFGASFGGPIQKDKTFYYAVYEGIRSIQGFSEGPTTVPAAGCRAAAGTVITTTQCPQMLLGIGMPTVGNAGVTPITSATVGPDVGRWLTGTGPGFSPLPTNTANNTFSYGFASLTGEDYGQMRVDHTISSNDNAFIRYTIDNDHTTLYGGLPGIDQLPRSRGQWATIGENHIFSPTLLSTATFGYSRSDIWLGGPKYLSGPGFSFNPDLATPLWMGAVSITGSGSLTNGGLFISEGKQSIFSYGYDMFYTHGKHSLKFGSLINRFQVEAVNGTGSTGGLTFASLYNLYTEQVASYGINVGQPILNIRKDVRFFTLGFYVQDDYRATSKLTLNLGIRYEPNTNMNVQHGLGTAVANPFTDNEPTTGHLMMMDPSYHNFSPRVGFAYDVFGNGKTAIRGGYSFLQNVSTFIGFLHLSIKELPEENAYTVGSPTPLIASTAKDYTTTPPDFTVPFTTPPLTNLGTRTPTTYHYGPQGQQPRGSYWNLSVQQQLPFNMGLTVAYTGSHSIGLITYTQGNPVLPLGVPGSVTLNGVTQACVLPPQGTPTLNIAAMNWTDGPSATSCWLSPNYGYGTTPCVTTATPTPACATYGAPNYPTGEQRMNPNWGSISELQAKGASWYNSMQVTAQKSLSNGMQFQAAFTWSHNFDITQSQSSADAGSGTSTNQLSGFKNGYDRSDADFDVPVTFRLNMIYNFPQIHSNKLVNGFVNGWWVSPIYQAQTGSDWNPSGSSNRSWSNGDPERPSWAPGRNPYNATHGVSQCSPTGLNAAYAGRPLGTSTLYFDPCAFVIQPEGFYGNVGRNALRGPRFQTVDFSLVKNTKFAFLGEAGNVEFRAEIFNILNHANFGTPNTTTYTGKPSVPTNDVETVTGGTSSTVGNMSTTTLSSSRDVQLALKFSF